MTEPRLTWFAQRTHPVAPGMIQVQGFATEGEARRQVAQWHDAGSPEAHYWERPPRWLASATWSGRAKPRTNLSMSPTATPTPLDEAEAALAAGRATFDVFSALLSYTRILKGREAEAEVEVARLMLESEQSAEATGELDRLQREVARLTARVDALEPTKS